MTNKEQIEEMARELCGKSKFINGEYVCGMLNFKCNCHCNYGSYAERSINAGYRKVGENEIVISKKEYNRLKGFYDTEKELLSQLNKERSSLGQNYPNIRSKNGK